MPVHMTLSPSNESFEEKLTRLKEKIQTADAILIGAGAGLSTSAGFVYNGERFRKYFSDFAASYGFDDMYTGGFFPYKTPEKMWAYWSKMIFVNRYMDPPKPLYEELLALVRDKDYFVLTTNVDHCFQKAGFDKQRLFYTQGDYGLFQCSKPCCSETFDNEAMVRAMITEQKNLEIPSELIPVCPHCGRPLTTNLRSDDRFVQDAGWYQAADRYEAFLERTQHSALFFLELGVGYNTPGIIKYPFWQMAAENPKSFYVSLNQGQAYAPKELRDRALCFNEDIGDVLQALDA